MAPRLNTLADKGVYFGASSWKYPGWAGSIYTTSRYETRGTFSQAKFDRECLAEYSLTFPIVGGDFSFYQFPSRDLWEKLFAESQSSLRFILKVPEEITVPVWPGHARYGNRAGLVNEHFLDAKALTEAFLRPLAPHGRRVAALVFEFGAMSKKAVGSPEEFLDKLDGFLDALPEGPQYSVECRNPEYLGPDYFRVLKAYNVAHVFNAWTRMPELADQIAMPGAFTADFTVVRALLRKGRGYEDAVQAFEPYERVQEPNERARQALVQIAHRAIESKNKAYMLINNRLEGNAPGTIEAVADAI